MPAAWLRRGSEGRTEYRIFFDLLPSHPHLRSACEGCQRCFLHAAVAGKGVGKQTQVHESARHLRCDGAEPPAAPRTDKDGPQERMAPQAVPGTSPGKWQTATQTGNKSTDI